MKKVLFINHTADMVGGAEDDFERLLKFFSGKKDLYDVDGLFPMGPRSFQYSSYCNKSFHYKWGIYPVIFDKFSGYLYYFIKSFIQFNALHKQFKNKNYDICIVNVAVLLWPAIYFKLKKSKIIFFIRETIYPDASRKLYYKLISRIGDFFFSVSEKLKTDFILITGNTNIETAFSAIEKASMKNDHLKMSDFVSEEKHSKIISPNVFRFLNIGMITKRKNQIMILRALNILLKKSIPLDPIVFFIGKFGNEPDIVDEFNEYMKQNYLSDHVVLLGELNREVYYEIAKHMDSYIISSLSEGMPIVLVEAFKLKKPVISTKVGGIEDVIQDKITGLLVDLDEKSLADAMEKLMNEPYLAKNISDNAYEVYNEKFDLERNLSVINKVIERITINSNI